VTVELELYGDIGVSALRWSGAGSAVIVQWSRVLYEMVPAGFAEG
jgi:hypothetical protein